MSTPDDAPPPRRRKNAGGNTRPRARKGSAADRAPAQPAVAPEPVAVPEPEVVPVAVPDPVVAASPTPLSSAAADPATRVRRGEQRVEMRRAGSREDGKQRQIKREYVMAWTAAAVVFLVIWLATGFLTR